MKAAAFLQFLRSPVWAVFLGIMFPEIGWMQTGGDGSRFPGADLGAGGAPGGGQSFSQSNIESVELERLRLAKEASSLLSEETAFREQVALLLAKLGRASLMAVPAAQISAGLMNDYRIFLSANAGDIKQTQAYYEQLKATLNELIPENPYNSGRPAEEGNVVRAEQKLQGLFEFPEDEGISRNILAQIAAVRGGTWESDKRRGEIGKELQDIATEKARITHNLSVLSKPDLLSGAIKPENLAKIDAYQGQLKRLEEKESELRAEGAAGAPATTKALRELQFQQFILELSFQQRYIHALIASGFYRLYSRNMAIQAEAYPKRQGGESEPDGAADAQAEKSPNGLVVPGSVDAMIPHISNVPALETYLMNRIRDAGVDRASVENMLKSRQLAAAENVIRKMVLTAKYQPELQTLPYEERQRVLRFGENVRKLSDAMTTRNYTEIHSLADTIEEESADPGMADIRSFALEHPRKSLRWVRQAELALTLGDQQSMVALMDAANRRAPLDDAVEAAIRQLEEDIKRGGRLLDEMIRLIEEGKSEKLFDRMEEFAPLAYGKHDSDLRSKFEALIEREKLVRATLEKCNEYESRSAYADVWIVLSGVSADALDDARLAKRRDAAERQCRAFSAAYDSAMRLEESGRSALALAWYLTALAEAPAVVGKLKERIEGLAEQLAKE